MALPAYAGPIGQRVPSWTGDYGHRRQPSNPQGTLYQPMLPAGHQRKSSESFTSNRVNPIRLTWVLITVCTAAFAWQMWIAHWKFVPMKENMMGGPSTMDLIANGAQLTPCIVGLHSEGQWWRLFVSQFLHGGVLHWGFNMYGLYALAAPMEQDFGLVRVLLIYLAAGTSSALSTALLLPQAVCLGASGAICGLIGAEWAELIMNLSLYGQKKCRRFREIFLPTIFLFLLSLLPGVNFFAHFSGMVCGLFLGMSLVIRSRYGRLPTQALYKKSPYGYQALLAALGVVATIGLLLIQLVLVYELVDVNQYCSWCKYLPHLHPEPDL